MLLLDPPLNGATRRDGVLHIEFMAPGVRARRVVSRSNMRPTGRFPSFRAKRSLCWDSVAELNWFRLLECDPGVVEYREQPCIVHYVLDSAEHRHFPDTLVRTSASRALWEVKTAADARRPEIAARTQLLAAHLPAHGYQYGVALAEDLRREPRLGNARFLLRHGRGHLSFEQREFCRRLFTSLNSLKWADVLTGTYAPLTLNAACRLVLEGVLELNITEPFDSQDLRVRTPLNPTVEHLHG